MKKTLNALSALLVIGLSSVSAQALSLPNGPYNLNNGDACALALFKVNRPSVVVTCGADTLVDMKVDQYAKIPNNIMFKQELTNNFVASLVSDTGVLCTESDNAQTYLIICKSK